MPLVVCPSPLLDGLFTASVTTAELRSFRGRVWLSEQDKMQMLKAGAKRRDEFAAGRLCAVAALNSLGASSHSVGRELGGAPIWPTGVVGSISHTDDLAVAVAAPSEIVKAIGVDIELVGGLETALWAICFSETEQSQLHRANVGLRSSLATALFAAKEAFYKAQWPVTREWVDFLDVEVELGENRFSIVPRRRRDWYLCLGSPLHGRFGRVADVVVATIEVPSP